MWDAKAICKMIDALKQQASMIPRQPISFDPGCVGSPDALFRI
jgi:hypothetical protein